MNMNLHALLQTPAQQSTVQTVQTRTEGTAQAPTALSKEFAELLVAMQNSTGTAYAPAPDQHGSSLAALAGAVELAVKTDTTSEQAADETALDAGMTDPMLSGIQAATAHSIPLAGLPANGQTGNTEQATAMPHSIAAADSNSRQQHAAASPLPSDAGDATMETPDAMGTKGSYRTDFTEIARQEAALSGQKPEVQAQAAGSQPSSGPSAERSDTGMNLGIAGAGTTTASDAGTAARTPVQAQLQSHVSSPQWRQELGQQLVTLAQHGERQISLQLNPQDLGPLNIEIKVSEQLAQMHMSSTHAQVRTALEQALPQLREALMEQGISLGETSISDQQPKQRESFSNNSDQQPSADTAQHLPAAADITESGSEQTDSLQGINLYV